METKDLESPYSWKPKKVVSYTTCGKCGAELNIENIDIHLTWHQYLETMFNELKQRIKSGERKNF